MSEKRNRYIDFAFAKEILTNDVFICVFPRFYHAQEGDRVVAQDDKGNRRIGDILYKGFAESDDSTINAVINCVYGGVALKAVSYWNRRCIEWPVDEENEDGAPAEDSPTVSC